MNDQTAGDPQGGRAPTEEEVRAALDEQLRNVRAEDVLLQTAATLVNLAAQRLGLTAEPGSEAPPRDVDQARLAIDGVRALLPLCPQEQADQLRQALSQLQLAYAREAPGDAGAAEQAGAGEGGEGGAEPDPDAEAHRTAEERAKARSRIWTPPGSS